MRTLYLRNVPDAVAEDLGRLAERAGMSVTAFAVRELTESSRRAGNAAWLGTLPDLGVSSDAVVDAVHAGRRDR